MRGRLLLMHPLVQIDLPPYTDYASLEQKLTLAVECVSIPTRYLRILMTLHLQGDCWIWSGVEKILSTLTPFAPSNFLPLSCSDARLPSHVSHARFQCLPCFPSMCCDPTFTMPRFLSSIFCSTRLGSDTTAYLVDYYLCATKA